MRNHLRSPVDLRALSSVMAVFFAMCAIGEEPNLHLVEKDGKVVEAYFYGPAQWLSSHGERIGRFPHLEKITLACGEIGIAEVEYLATIKSLKHIATGEFPEDKVTFSPGAIGELRNMTWLECLEVYQNQLPAHEWHFLTHLEAIAELHLDCLSGLDYLEGSKLESLFLYRDSGFGNAVSLPKIIGTLQNLKHLVIFSRGIDPPRLPDESLCLLTQLSKLESLYVYGVDARTLAAVAKLSNLQRLTIMSVSLEADITLLRNMKYLRELTIDVKLLNASEVDFLAEFERLELLSIRCPQSHYAAIQAIPFEKMPSLERVHLRTTALESDVLSRVAALPRIKGIVVQSLGEGAEEIELKIKSRGVELTVEGRRFRPARTRP